MCPLGGGKYTCVTCGEVRRKPNTKGAESHYNAWLYEPFKLPGPHPAILWSGEKQTLTFQQPQA